MAQTYESALEWLREQPQFEMVLESVRDRRERNIALLHDAINDFDLRVISGKIQETDSLLEELGG